MKFLGLTFTLLLTTVLLLGQDPSIVYPYEFKATSNPIIKHMRTADPSCHVWADGKLWMYPSHDPDNAGNNYDGMDGYHVFSTEDLVNWTDHGEVLHSRDVAWNGTGSMWAPDCAYKDGKYYLYFPSKINSTSFRTGVAISDKPEGPFVAEPDFIQGTTGIDPMCFIDDDGQAYLYFGYSGNPFVAKLKDNMIELAEEMRRINIGTNPEAYVEGTWIHKYNGKYYMSWSNYKGWEWNGKKYGALYAVGDSPYGPFEYKGGIKENPPGAQDHHSIVEYHGQWYIFYHTGKYDGGNSWKRNVCVDYLYHNPDGTIQEVQKYNPVNVKIDSVSLVDGNMVPGTFNAAKYYKQSGTVKQGTSLGSINNIDEIEYVVDVLGSDPYDVTLHYDAVIHNGSVEMYVNNSLKATATIDGATVKEQIQLYKGRHLLKFVFKSESFSEIIVLDSITVNSGFEYFKVTTDAGSGAEIQPAEVQYYKEATDADYSIQGNSGYRVKDVLVDGESKGAVQEYTFSAIDADHNISATFESCETDVKIYTQVGNLESTEETVINAELGKTVYITPVTEEGTYFWDGPSVTTTEKDISFPADVSHKGTYILTFTNTSGCTTVHEIEINIVLTAIQAEDYTDMSGVKKENCLDDLGGQQLGFIQNGDWASYSVNIEKRGMYALSYRVASPSSSGNIEFVSDGKILKTKNIKNTGGWHAWETTAPVEIPFEMGQHNVKLNFKGSTGYLFNLNWFKIEYAGAIIDTMDFPSVKILSPDENSDFTEGSNVPVSIYANDNNGDVSKVEVYLNNELIKTFTDAPYNFTIEGIAKGNLSIRAEATDNDGNVNKATYNFTVKAIRSAYQTFQAEDFDKSSPGLNVDAYCTPHVGGINGGEWIMFSSLDFGSTWAHVKVNATAGYDRPGSKLEIRLDAVDGPKVGEIAIDNTGGWCNYKEHTASINAQGVHSLYLVFVGGADIYDLDWISIEQSNAIDDITLQDALNVYPNPANSVLNIRCDVSGVKTLSLFSVDVREILKRSMNHSSEQIDISAINRGLYLVTIQTTKGRITKSVLIE